MAEVRACGSLDPVRAVSEVDRVEVGSQDPVLRPDLLEPPCKRSLLQLPRHRVCAASELVLHELLRDGRAALHGGFLPDVGPERAPHAADVDAAMFVEALVLGRDDRLFDPRRDLVARHEHAALAPSEDRENGVAVACVDVAVDLLARRLRERVEPAQLLADRDDNPVRERREREHAQDADESEEAELADPALGSARSRRLGAFSTEQHGSRRF